MIPCRQAAVETAAEHHEQIRILQHEVRIAMPHAARRTEIQRVVKIQQINGLPCEEGRYARLLAQLLQRRLHPRNLYAVADEEDGTLCHRKKLSNLVDGRLGRIRSL